MYSASLVWLVVPFFLCLFNRIFFCSENIFTQMARKFKQMRDDEVGEGGSKWDCDHGLLAIQFP